jgi:hypothetical protein
MPQMVQPVCAHFNPTLTPAVAVSYVATSPAYNLHPTQPREYAHPPDGTFDIGRGMPLGQVRGFNPRVNASDPFL